MLAEGETRVALPGGLPIEKNITELHADIVVLVQT
jgi:hypothetical protein